MRDLKDQAGSDCRFAHSDLDYINIYKTDHYQLYA